MKWVKDDKSVQIENCISVDKGNAINVVTNAFDEGKMPADWKEAIPDSDKENQEILILSVKKWAEKNGYTESNE